MLSINGGSSAIAIAIAIAMEVQLLQPTIIKYLAVKLRPQQFCLFLICLLALVRPYGKQA